MYPLPCFKLQATLTKPVWFHRQAPTRPPCCSITLIQWKLETNMMTQLSMLSNLYDVTSIVKYCHLLAGKRMTKSNYFASFHTSTNINSGYIKVSIEILKYYFTGGTLTIFENERGAMLLRHKSHKRLQVISFSHVQRSLLRGRFLGCHAERFSWRKWVVLNHTPCSERKCYWTGKSTKQTPPALNHSRCR